MLARPGRLLCRAGAAGLCRAAGASQPLAKKAAGPPPWGGLDFIFSWYAGQAMPGRFAETVGLDDSFEIFFLGRIPTLARAMPGPAR